MNNPQPPAPSPVDDEPADDDPCDSAAVTAAVHATLESEDSSYDSDYENSESLSPCCCHSDVSRTASDTLGAEYSDWLTDSLLCDPSYNRCVEFGLKLGYTELQVQRALQKLGPGAGTNDLLAELIRLGTSSDTVHPTAQASGQTAGAQASALQVRELETAEEDGDEATQLRHIVIDGSNVAMSHGNKEYFSCRGIRLCVDWFQGRGHREITVFVPKWRKEAARPDAPIQDQEILLQLERDRLLVFTPSRQVAGRRMVCYDDRYILKLASDVEGIVVSNDNYRDLISENPEYRKVVDERLLMYSFVNDRFMPPEDPLGRHGPSLDQFLRRPVSSLSSNSGGSGNTHLLQPPCPYGKKCTYGNKCKYRHPERGNLPQKSVTERLVEQAKIQLQEVKSRNLKQQGSRDSSPGEKMRGQTPLHATTSCDLSGFHKTAKKLPLSRTKSLVTSSALSSPELFDSENRRLMGMASMSQHPQQAKCNTSSSVTQGWAKVSLNLLQNIPPPRAEMFLEPDAGGHLSVAKRLSDPESSKPPTSSFSRLSMGSQAGFSGPSASPTISTSNLHKKLQRQLTLNPSYDPRLCNIHGCVGDGSPSSLKKKKAASQEHIPDPLRTHAPLTRLDSDPRLMHCQHLTVQQHPNVMRISSAPDSSRQFSPTEPIQKLNSTSDTRLNVSPLSGQRYSYLAVPQSSWLCQDSSSPLKPVLVRPASVPPQAVIGSPLGTPRAMSPDPLIIDDPRRRLFYHLASIFPEEHVQRAMDMYPEETNPQKLCAVILNLFPK